MVKGHLLSDPLHIFIFAFRLTALWL